MSKIYRHVKSFYKQYNDIFGSQRFFILFASYFCFLCIDAHKEKTDWYQHGISQMEHNT